MVTRIASPVLMSAALALASLSFGCERTPPTVPTSGPVPAPRIAAISPNVGSVRGGDAVSITGTGFREGLTAKADGEPLTISAITSRSIMATMPGHAEGVADLVVTNTDGQTGRLPAAFTYVVMPDLAVTGVSPNEGSTRGGTVLRITGTSIRPGAIVTLDDILVPTGLFADPTGTGTTVVTPPHAAGAVDIAVTNPDGSSARLIAGYTYVSPASFDVNGTWKGQSDHLTDNHIGLDLVFTIENNALVSLSCGPNTLTFSPAPPVDHGQFSFSGEDGVSLSGNFVSATQVRGRIRLPPCGDGWSAFKR